MSLHIYSSIQTLSILNSYALVSTLDITYNMNFSINSRDKISEMFMQIGIITLTLISTRDIFFSENYELTGY